MTKRELFPLNPVIQFRKNQLEGVDAVIDYWSRGGRHPVLNVATGGGKSITIGEICRRLLNIAPSTRIGVVTLSQELVQQDYNDIKLVCPKIPVGIVMAALGKRQYDKQVIVGSIQTLYKSLGKTGGFHVILVDECHTISLLAKPDEETGEIPEDVTMFGRFLEENAKIVPKFRMCGLTATPWRQNNLPICGWERGRFSEIIYTFSIAEALELGYLVPPQNQEVPEKISTAGLKTSAATGDYVERQLAEAANDDAINIPAVAATIEALKERNSAVVFCTSIEHAYRVRDLFRESGVHAEAVHGSSGGYKMSKTQRRKIIQGFRDGKYKVLVNCLVLLIGFDHKALDVITCLRPTKSSAAWLQLIGRGLRCSPETNKTDCLVLDYTENTEYFGPIDAIEPPKPPERRMTKKREDELGNIKECDNCRELIPIQSRTCPSCGNEFPGMGSRGPEINDVHSTAALLSSQTAVDRMFHCTGLMFAPHRKLGKPDTLRVDYYDGMRIRASEWVCFDHDGAPRVKATSWWHRMGGQQPAPNSVEEAYQRRLEIAQPTAITCRKDGKWDRVVKVTWEELADAG